jgi:hypothetical protein
VTVSTSTFGSVADAFAVPPKTKSMCKVCDILDALPEGRELVEAALAAPPEVWSAREVARRLVAQGWTVGDTSVLKHRSRCVNR